MNSMSRWVLVALAAGCAVPRPLAGQGRSVVVGGYAGAYTHLVNFNNSGTADFRPSYNVGATLGVQLDANVGVHADVTYSRAHARGPTNFAGQDFSRLFVGLHLEYRYPMDALTPFGFAGGGAMFVSESATLGTVAPFTKFAGSFGAGLAYAIPRSRTQVFAEIKTLVSGWDRGMIYRTSVGAPFVSSRINTTLVDVTAALGLSYTFPQ
jgi:outer membrane protein with beta-barrel domain